MELNKVYISDRKELGHYYEMIIRRCQPLIYKKYKCIKLRFRKEELHFIIYLTEQLWNIGLIIKGLSKKKGAKKMKKEGWGEYYELTLIKIPRRHFRKDDYIRSFYGIQKL